MSSETNLPKRLLTCLAAILVVTSGCLSPAGSPAEDEPPTPTNADTLDEPNEAGDTNSSANTTESDGTSKAQDNGTGRTNGTDSTNETAADEAPGERTIQHAMGETTIEGATTRIVALEYNLVENVLALGLQPVGVANPDGYRKWVQAGGLSEDVEDVGTRAEPSLETIAELEPDLILGIQFRHEDIYDELSGIAPTLVFEGFPGEGDEDDQYDRMLSIFDRTAKATARQDEAEDVHEDIQLTYERARGRLEAADKDGREILLTQLFTYQGQPLARTFIDGSIPDNVAERTGLVNAWTKTACSTGYGYCDINKEGFADVQHADFFYQAQPNDDPVEDEWQDDPVWNSYEFVREDRVYALGADAWMFGGPLVVQKLTERILAAQVG